MSLLFFASCDCTTHVTGTVIDRDTKEPIDSVYYSTFLWRDGITDSTGSFTTGQRAGAFGCIWVKVDIHKEGYIPKTVTILANGNRKVKLKKEE